MRYYRHNLNCDNEWYRSLKQSKTKFQFFCPNLLHLVRTLFVGCTNWFLLHAMPRDDETNPTPLLSLSSANPSYHLALSFSNIKNDILLVLNRESVHYSNWGWIVWDLLPCLWCFRSYGSYQTPPFRYLWHSMASSWLCCQKVDLWRNFTRSLANCSFTVSLLLKKQGIK